MSTLKFFTVPELLTAAELASQRGYNRQLSKDQIDTLTKMKLDGADTKFPVVFSMSHGHAQGVPVDPHVRVMLALGSATEMLDVDSDLFSTLGEVDYPKGKTE